MRFLKLLVIGLLFLTNPKLLAQNIAPKYSNEFLNIGVGARALGLGGAHVSLANDVTAAYWNPAGLALNKNRTELSLMHSEYFAGIAKYDYVGFTTTLQNQSSLGISLIRFGIDDIPDTRFLYDANGALNYNNIQFFNAADYALILSFAKRVSQKFQWGGNAKIIHRNVGRFANAWGFGLDIGGLYQVGQWKLGLMLRDITTTFNVWTHNPEMLRAVYQQTDNVLPINSIELTLPKGIFSFYRAIKLSEKLKGITVVDFELTFDGQRNVLIGSNLVNIDPKMGLELVFDELLAIRLGGSTFQRVRDFDQRKLLVWKPAMGIGLNISPKFYIDYALSDIGGVSQTPYSHVFSLKLLINEGNVQ